MSDPLTVLREAAEEVEQGGAVAGEEFFVHSVSTGMVSADYYGLKVTPGGAYEVYYSERGERRVLVSTPDPQEARRLFVERVLAEVQRRRGAGR